jgi:insulysin
MMSTQSSIYWNEIISQQYNFDRVNIEVAYLRTITQPQLLNFYKVIIHFILHISHAKYIVIFMI